MSLLQFVEDEIIDQYQIEDNNRPWVLGFSGGKDSTMLLQKVWYAMRKLGKERCHRPVYVVCNDTMVENPKIVGFINDTLDRITTAAAAQELPIIVQRTLPQLLDSFWVNLIGKGYPAPSSTFRWCTERLKINPTTRFIKTKISEAGEVIILLGTRSAESTTRARSMKKHAVHGVRLRKHILPGASVFAPIRDIDTDTVWKYLMQAPPPWGGTNRDLITLYRNASVDADCPLVIDTDSPSCGKSRFGCYVCTVVARDKSMEGLIENGEEWMTPLAELRDYLIETRDTPEVYRDPTTRRGKTTEGTWGPYLPHVRAEILRRLLVAQREIQVSYDETLRFVTYQELVAIQMQWHRDGLYDVSVADIYNSIYPTSMPESDGMLRRRQDEIDLLREVCADNPDHFDLISQAVLSIRSKSLLVNRKGRYSGVEQVLDNYLKKKGIQ